MKETREECINGYEERDGNGLIDAFIIIEQIIGKSTADSHCSLASIFEAPPALPLPIAKLCHCWDSEL